MRKLVRLVYSISLEASILFIFNDYELTEQLFTFAYLRNINGNNLKELNFLAELSTPREFF